MEDTSREMDLTREMAMGWALHEPDRFESFLRRIVTQDPRELTPLRVALAEGHEEVIDARDELISRRAHFDEAIQICQDEIRILIARDEQAGEELDCRGTEATNSNTAMVFLLGLEEELAAARQPQVSNDDEEPAESSSSEAASEPEAASQSQIVITKEPLDIEGVEGEEMLSPAFSIVANGPGKLFYSWLVNGKIHWGHDAEMQVHLLEEAQRKEYSVRCIVTSDETDDVAISRVARMTVLRAIDEEPLGDNEYEDEPI